MSSDLPLRPIQPEDFRAAASAIATAFAEPDDSDEWIERERSVFEFDRSIAAFDGSAVAGTGSLYSTSLRVPGADLPTGVVTWISVLRGYRRRGLLNRMMRHLLDDVRDRGEPLAALWASEAPIYGRYGFVAAGQWVGIRMDRYAGRFRSDAPAGGTVRPVNVDAARALFPPVYAAAREQHLGMPARTAPGWWDYQVLADPKDERKGFGPKEFAVHETDGVVDGYVVSHIKDGEWEDGLPDGVLEVTELVATTPEGWAGLWRSCLETDLVGRIEAWSRPIDDPLLHLLADPRRARRTVLDGLYLRLVDLPSALGGRTWTGTDRLVLDVRDDFCPANAGRWSLDVTDGRAACQRTDDAADLELDAEGLAAVYLSDTRAIALRAAGRLRECRAGATQRLDAVLGTSVSPWTPETF